MAVDDEKVIDIHTSYTKDAFAGDGILVRRGKKNYRKVTLG